MDHFLKAHSVKNRSTKKTDNPGLKNTLKRMMHGYRHNDNGVIRSATELPSRAEDSDFAMEVDLQDDSDIEFVDNIQTQGTSAPARSPSRSPARLSASPLNRLSSSPSGSSSSSSPVASQIHLPSSYVSLKGADNVGEMMDTINGILHSSSENSYAGVSDLDSSVHDIATYDLMDSSVELSNISSSSDSRFDKDGLLASRILQELERCNANPCNVNVDSINNDNDARFHDSMLLKNGQQLKPKCVSNNGDCQKKKSRKKIKEPSSNKLSQYISIDASEHSLPGVPDLIKNFKCGVKTYAINRNFQYEGKASDIFNNKMHSLRKADINHFSDDTDSNIAKSEHGDDLPLHDSSLESNQFIMSPLPAEDNIAFDESISNLDKRILVDSDYNSSNSIEFHYLKKGCVLVLRHPSRIYITGKVKGTALCGAADVMGYRLQESAAQMFAPRFSYALDIQTVAESSSQYGLFGKLTALGLSVADTEDIVVSLEEHDSVIYLEPLLDIALDFVEREFTADVFKKSSKIMTEQFPEAAEQLSCTLYSDKPCKSFEENAIWPEIIKFGLGSNSKGIVCGGKSTGKSTFLKYYVNKMLRNGPVLLVDLDPGQSELTVSGNISYTVVKNPLIGPNFTHLQKPNRMLNLGLINVEDSLERYAVAVRKLLDHAASQEELLQLPWIINTMGMTNALGLKLITYIILLAKPTLVVQMDSNIQKKCFGTLLNSHEIKRMYAEEYESDPIFESVNCPDRFTFQYYMSSPKQMGQESNLTAKDERYLSFLSYFGNVLSRKNTMFLGTKPYVLPLESLKIAANSLDDLIVSVINAKIVALCEEHTVARGKTFALGENSLICHGHGVVRAVDMDSKCLYIITPERRETLANVNVLVYSESQPDLVLDAPGLAERTCLPYRAVLQPHNRLLMKTPKRRFNPLPHLLKMKKLRANTSQK